MFSKISIHKVGNKINGDALVLSKFPCEFEEDLNELLTDFFLKSFKGEETYRFFHDSYLTNNDVYQSVANIFEDQSCFHEESENLANRLYEIAQNPRVKSGEFYVVYFSGEEGDAGKIDSIGLFKSENKETFLKVYPNDLEFDIERDFGISLSKIDKGCLIYNNDKEEGFVVKVVDNHKNGDAPYWVDDFLHIKQRDDDYFHTESTLNIYKEYITKQLPQEFEVSKADQADFLNKTINYFQDQEEFTFDKFTKEVLVDDNVIESFGNFKTDYETEYQMNVSETFPINNTAVKKQARSYKSVIKLDKNFHIYVHGDRKMLEQDEDEKGKFYRLYYNQEN